MFDTNKFFNPGTMMSRIFRKVDNVVWDMMTGKIGILSNGGISSIDGEGDGATITTNLVEQFSMAVPAFAQQTSISDVKVGDMILQANDKPAWVVARIETEDKASRNAYDAAVVAGVVPQPVKVNVSFELLRADGTTTKYRAPKVVVLGLDTSGVMVVRSLISMLPGGQGGLGQMQNMMMMMGMFGSDSGDLEDIMPMMLMSQMGGVGALMGTGQADPGAANGMNQMMQTMLMAKLMGGGVGKRNKRDSYDNSGSVGGPFRNR
jgi:hypothetical protein